MSNKEIFDQKMDALADSINAKAGSTGQKTLDGLKTAVDSINAEYVSVKVEQTFTETEKAQGRANLGEVELLITYDDDTTGTLTVVGNVVDNE